MKRLRLNYLLNVFLIINLSYLATCGQGLPMASPGDAGLSSERLNRIDAVMNDYVKNG